MPDAVTKTSTRLGFGLLFCLGVGYVTMGVVFSVMAITSHEIPWFLKALIVFGILGMGILMFAVVRNRLIEYKTDKYKDVEV